MDKSKCPTFRIAFCIFFVGQYVNSLDESLFVPFVKNMPYSAQFFTDGDKGEMNKEISSSTFVESPSKLNTLDQNGKRRQFHNFHSQKTKTQFHSMHQGKSCLESESHFPQVQQVRKKQHLSNRQPDRIVPFLTDDDEDKPKNIRITAASLHKNEKTKTRAFQNDLSNQVNFLFQKTHSQQVPGSAQSRKGQENIDLVQNVDQDNNFSFDLNGLNDEDFPPLFVLDDSGIKHSFREETSPTFRDQGGKEISNKDRNFLFTENSLFFKNTKNLAESKDDDLYQVPVDTTENKEISKTYYFGKDGYTSRESVKNLPIIYGVSNNKNWPKTKRKPSKNRRVSLKSGYLIKMKGNLPGIAINTNSEGNLNEKNRRMIFHNIMLNSGSSAKTLSAVTPQISSKNDLKGAISVGKTDLNSQSSLTRNGLIISVHNNNITSRNNLKNRWKNKAFNLGVELDSNDNLKKSERKSIAMNAHSQMNKGTETVLRKEISGFEPSSKSQTFKGENKIFIHNINLSSKDSAAENKKSTFESGSINRVELKVDDRSKGKGLGKIDNRKTETKDGFIGIGSIRKTNFENWQGTPSLFTFEPVTKSSLTKEKNNVFFQDIKLGSGDSSSGRKKTLFESRSLKESGFVFDDSSSKDKGIGKLIKSTGFSSPNSTRQENSIFESHLTNRSKEKGRLNFGKNTVKDESTLFVHNINLGSKNENSRIQGLGKKTVKEKSLNEVPIVKKIIENNFGQEKNNVDSKNIRFFDANKTPTSVNQKSFDSGSISKGPNFLVHDIHLNSESSFMGSRSSIDTNNKASIHHSKKGRPVKITNAVTDIRKTQPISDVYIESIKLGLATASRNGRGRQRNFNKGKNTNISVEGKTIQLNKAWTKNKANVSVKSLESGPLISPLMNASSNFGSGPFSKGGKKRFFRFGSSSDGSSRKNKTNTFFHSINLDSKVSSIGKKSSAFVLESKGKVLSNDIFSKEKSNLKIFSSKFKGKNQGRHNVGKGGEEVREEESDLISDNPKITVHEVDFGSRSRMAQTNGNSLAILKNKSGPFAAETPENDQVVKDFQHQSIFNWNALNDEKSLQRQIPSRKRIVIPVTGNKPHFRYIFSGSDRLNPSNQMANGDSSVPMSSGLTNNKGKNKLVTGPNSIEQTQFVAHTKDALICRHLVDVIFVLDGSDSIDIPSMEQMKTFVINFMSGFQIHQMAAMFGAVIYSSNVSGVTNLGSTANRLSLYAAIRDLPHEMSGTNTATGIQRMRQMFTMHSRPEVPKIAIVITDGRSKNYSLTTTQAHLAQQEGITIFAVGVGQLVDKDELRNIAAYGKVRTVASFRELQKLTYKLAREVCTLITPTTTSSSTTIVTTASTTITHAPVRNIIPLKDYTKYYSLPPNVCEKCRLVNGVGYREHPRDCQLYIQCYFLGNNIKSVTRDCGLGQFWDQQVLTCKPAHLVNCITDQCRISKIPAYRNKYNCRAYWICIDGKSYGKCCQPGHTYVEGSGCVQNNSCRHSCQVNQLLPGICPLKIVPGDDTVFKQNIAGHGWKVQKCAPGTFFNISTCSCNAFLKQQSSLPQTCKPEIRLTFDRNDGAMFGRQNGIKNENVTVQNGVAKFNGNSRLLLWRFANAYLGKKVFVQIKFREKGHSSHTEAILSNGDCDHEPSLYIAAERKTKQLHMGAVTDFGTSDVKIAYNTNDWKKVTYMFDGGHVTGSVNGMRKTGRTITGKIQSRQCTMQIGTGYGMHNFNGEIDEFSLYLCKPENL